MSLLRTGACVLALLALYAAPLAAQTPGAPAAAPTAPAPPLPLETVPVGEISARAQAVAEQVRSLEESLAVEQEQTGLQADLVRLSERVEAGAREVAREIAKGSSISELAQMRIEWAGLERQVDAREDGLRKWIAARGLELEALKGAQALWQRTLDEERKRGTPQPILETARGALADLKRGADLVQGKLNDALVLQNQFAALHAQVQTTLASVQDARRGVFDNLFKREDPPLWSVDLAEHIRHASDWPLIKFLRDFREQGSSYLADHPEPVLVQLLIFGFLVWALRRTRTELTGMGHEGKEDADSPIAGARLATRHPVAAAMLLALLLTPLLHDALPRPVVNVLRLMIAIPAVLVLRTLLGDALKTPLYLLAVFFVVDRVREILAAVAPGRVIFFGEMVALAAVLIALMRRRRLDMLPPSLHGNRWLAAVGLWIRFSVGCAVIAAFASLTGYTRIADLLGGGVLGSGYVALVVFAFVRIAEGLAAALFSSPSTMRMVQHHRELLLRRTDRFLRVLAMLLWGLAVTEFFGVRDPLFRGIGSAMESRIGFGEFEVTLGSLIAFALTLLGAWLLARLVRFVLDEEVFPRFPLARGVPFALSTLVRYAIQLIGFLVALSALGFDLDRITILLGAFGVGIGFGLQNVVNNFVSGLILLFERPVKVGDSVELGGTEGTVQRIGIRATTVRTFDGADVIIPNGALLSDRVINWTLSDRSRRLTISVGMAYGTELGSAMATLQQVAESQDGVCSYPKPVVAFMGFGDSALEVELRVWIEDADDLIETRTRLGIAIEAALRAAGIEIPFPQRTLHVASVTPEAAKALGAAPAAEPEGPREILRSRS